MRTKLCAVTIAVVMVLCFSARAEALIMINEFLADPALGLAGDANNDGARDSYDDEFVELFNLSFAAVDISNWLISDASAVRHYFDAGTFIGANSAFVVFGGGSPNLSGLPTGQVGIAWQTASQGQLNLNNTGDTITLKDAAGNVIDQIIYGSEAGYDQSLTRNPEGTKGEWVKHTILPNAEGKLFSPGYLVNAVPNGQGSHIPEPLSVLTLGMGFIAMIFRFRPAF